MPPADPPIRPVEPVFVVDLFPSLHAELIGLLRALRPDDWERPTLCPLWSVHDITAHLLDDDIRRLSSQRDARPLAPGPRAATPGALLDFINGLNAEWVAVARRMSPRVLIDLLEVTGPQIAALFASLDPFGPAHFAVSWAGESESPNWFDIGRDYTERWLHQQQIRVAVNAPGLVARRWLHPVLDLFVRCLPYAYRDVVRPTDATVALTIVGEAGGDWTLRRTEAGWRLYTGRVEQAGATVTMTPDTAWRLFSKALRGSPERDRVEIAGDQALGSVVLGALGVIA